MNILNANLCVRFWSASFIRANWLQTCLQIILQVVGLVETSRTFLNLFYKIIYIYLFISKMSPQITRMCPMKMYLMSIVIILSDYLILGPTSGLPALPQTQASIQSPPLLSIPSSPSLAAQMTQLPPPSTLISHQMQQRTNSSQILPLTVINPSSGTNNLNIVLTPPSSNAINSYTTAANDILLELRQEMLTKSIKFDDNFRSLLSSSKLGLHNMFTDTYGMLYRHNTEIFTSMFESLEQYYANGQVKLTKSMENFFDGLYQKVFQVYNSYRTFSPDDLKCATRQMSKLKPFKDVPDRLIDGIKRAFVSARTFVQALNRGIDVIKRIISVSRERKCVNSVVICYFGYVSLGSPKLKPSGIGANKYQFRSEVYLTPAITSLRLKIQFS